MDKVKEMKKEKANALITKEGQTVLINLFKILDNLEEDKLKEFISFTEGLVFAIDRTSKLKGE